MNAEEAEPYDEEQIRAWVNELLGSWRTRRDSADPAGAWYADLGEPLQTEAIVVRDAKHPIEATCLIFRHDPDRSDGEVECVVLSDPTPKEDGLRRWVLGELGMLVENSRRNWSLGSRFRADLPAWKHLSQVRLLPDEPVPTKAWFISRALHLAPEPSQFADLSLGTLLSRVALAAAPPPPAAPAPPVEHIPEVHENSREQTAFYRWIELNADDLMAALGVQQPYWFGLFLDRKDVFDEDIQGDIDFLGGPLEWTLGEDEFQAYLKSEAEAGDPAKPFARNHAMAVARAVKGGGLHWPSTPGTVVAGELKVSWFDAERQFMKPRDIRKRRARGETVVPGKWKGVHREKGARAKDELQILLDHGFHRVTFLHLGVTRARSAPTINPWFQALADADNAESKMARLFEPSEKPDSGFMTAVLGAVAHKHEGHAGAGGRLRVIQEPKENPIEPTWLEHLTEKLQGLSAPPSTRAFVRPCPTCECWHALASPHLPQSCE